MGDPIILSLGSVNADFQLRVDRAPATGETLPGREFMRLGGGKAANVAWLGRRFGVGTVLLARVGGDDLREQALAPLRDAGIDLSAVSTDPEAATGVAMIAVPPDGKKGIFLAANANATWTGADAAAAVATIRRAPAGSVLVVDCEVPRMVVEQAVDAARAHGLTVILDPSPADRVPEQVLAQATAVTPNGSEAERLTGIAVDGTDAAVEAARRLAGRGARTVCVKLGDGGCLVADQGTMTLIPPTPTEVVDTTGAGDAFAGALAVAMVEGRDAVPAAAFAVAASHLAVGGYGSQPAYPARGQVEALAARLLDGARAIG